MKRWYYTAFMLLLYVAVFRIWQSFPGRAMFLLGGGLTVGLMATGMIGVARRGYFANRRDLCLHALVDVLCTESYRRSAVQIWEVTSTDRLKLLVPIRLARGCGVALEDVA